MSPDERTGGAEDLELEGSEAESVIGGRHGPSKFQRTQTYEEEIFRLASQGYVECACIDGGTVMENPKTGHQITIKL